MHIIHPSFSVQFDYPVVFDRDVFAPGNRTLAELFDRWGEARRHRVAVVVDEGLHRARPGLIQIVERYFHGAPGLEMAGSPTLFPGGAAAKTGYDALATLLWQCGNLHLDRQSYILGIGGGSMLDAVGLAAALVHRGLRFVRMPSTVLAQCDAGIGVKNGLDEHGQKNFLGVFAPPFAVVNDFTLLDSLPTEHWLGGVAEAFKVAIIRDAAYFEALEGWADAIRHRDERVMEELIRRCAAIHLDHIAKGGDPFERGSQRPLDFGHWAAHRLEMLSERRIGHGQAVSIGIALDSFYACRAGWLTGGERDRIVGALAAVGLPLYAPELERGRERGELALLRGLQEFREHLGGRLTVTLPRGIGASVEAHEMNPVWIDEGLAWLRARSRQSRSPAMSYPLSM